MFINTGWSIQSKSGGFYVGVWRYIQGYSVTVRTPIADITRDLPHREWFSVRIGAYPWKLNSRFVRVSVFRTWGGFGVIDYGRTARHLNLGLVVLSTVGF